MPRTLVRFLALLLVSLLSPPGWGDPVHVVGAEFVRRPGARWDLILALAHEDQDGQHFCDRVEALDQDGRRIFFGSFYRPMPRDVEEDGPMRRRIRPVPLPEGVTSLRIRAHCKVSGWGGRALEVDLSKKRGPGYRLRSRPNRYLPDFEGISKHPEIRTWRKRYLESPVRWPFPPRGPVPAVPPEPVDRRPQGWRRAGLLAGVPLAVPGEHSPGGEAPGAP